MLAAAKDLEFERAATLRDEILRLEKVAAGDVGLNREELSARIAKLPTGPGVYILKDGAGRVLYVGQGGRTCGSACVRI